MTNSILVIPDAHASPKHNNDRFEWLGQLIVERKPDVIVNIGDFADMESLSSYDKGKKSFEGRRYKKDVKAAIDAQEKLFQAMNEYNDNKRATRHKQYKPRLVLTLGNHENRINRVVENSAELEGTISVDDLKYEEFGWEVYPFLEQVTIDGISFSHYFTSGVMGRAIGGEHPAYSLVTKMHQSCVQGHTHVRDFCERTTADGKRITCLLVGCYLDEDQWEDYAGQANKMWWKGVVILHTLGDGAFEPEWINIKQLKKQYGQ